MGKRSIMQGAALDRLDDLVDPVRLDASEVNLDACAFAIARMAASAMEADRLRDAHRFRTLQNEVERAEARDGAVEIRPSDALRLSATLHEYRTNLRSGGDAAGAEDVARVVRVIDGKIAGSASGPETRDGRADA